MATFVTNEGANGLTSGGTISWTGDTFKVRAVASSFTPTKNDTSMTGYTQVGTDQAIASPSKVKDTTNNRIAFKANAVTYTAVAGGSTIRYLVVYKFVTNDAGSTPIAVIQVTDQLTNGGDLTYTPDATNGYFYLQE